MPRESNAKKHEFIGVLIVLAAVLLLLCLISYNPLDPSFNTTSINPPENKIGLFGSNTSEFLFMLCGFSAFLIPLPLFILTWKLVFGREIRAPYLRAFGLFLLIAGVCAV